MPAGRDSADEIGKSEDVLEAVAELHHLPTDLFSLKDPEDEIQEYTVFTKVALREGFTLGPYAGHLLEESQSQDSPVNIMKIKDVKNANVRLCLTDDACSWLKLLRLTSNVENANISIALNGPRIWCRVKHDLEPNTELLVSHLTLDEDQKRPSVSPSYTAVIPFKHKLNFSSKDDDFRFKKHRTRTRKERSDSEENDTDDASDCKSPPSLEAGVSPTTLLNPGIKCEPRSPSSPPSSPAAPRDNVSAEVRNMKATPNASASNTAPYVNGYRYSAAFPYGTSDAPVADGRFKCPLCEITFSSLRTLQCHQMYYCSQRAAGLNSTSDTDPEDTSQPVKSEHLANADKSESPVSNGETSKQNTELPSSRKFTGSSSLYPCDENIPKSSNLLATVNNFGSRVGTPRAPRTYRCPYCNYTSDKKASLSRHVRMHGGNSPSSENDPPISTHPLARYCANCDIQFASFKNYQVHKNFYCSTRHVHKSMNSSAPSPSQQQSSQQIPSAARPTAQRASPEKSNASQESNQYNMMLNQPLYAAISTSPLILVPCSYVAGGGLSPAAGLVPAGNIIIPNTQSVNSPDGDQGSHGPNVIPTYTVMAGAGGSTASEDAVGGASSSPQAAERSAKVRRCSTEKAVVNSEPKCPSPIMKDVSKDDADKPLDLSCKKFTDNKSVTRKYTAKSPHESSNVLPISSASSSSSSSCADDAASPLIPLPTVPVVPGLSHSNVPTQAAVPSGMVLDPRTSSLTPAPVLGGPQILVKQGTSKCKECNIVFYKHENYLVHKSLYCASRLQKTQSTSPNAEKIIVDDEAEEKDEQSSHDNTNSKSPIITHSKTPDPSEHSLEASNHSPPNQGAVFQFYCMACGIKFTSIDNLTAHQTYYCPKREIISQPVGVLPALRGEYRCNKCKNVYPTEEALRHHPCVVQRKCPYCDVYCPTLSATQRHLVTHTGVKSFRCSLCGYKGHTLRGMRTHIRIHLDKNNTTPEEAYILCVDEGGSEIGSVNRKTQNRTATERNHSDTLHNESMVISLASTVTPSLVPSDIVPKKAIPDAVSDQVLSGDITHWCQICGYSSSYKGNVVRHVKLVHKDLMSSQSMASIVNSKPTIGNLESKQDIIESANLSDSNAETNDSVKSAVNGTSTMADAKQTCRGDEQSPILLKSESVSPPPVSATAARVKRSLSVESESASNSNASSSSKSGPRYCKACDISFNYLSNFLAHKKFYCTPRPGEPTPGTESGPVQSVQ